MEKKNDIIEVSLSVADVVDYLRMTGGFSGPLREVVKRKVTEEAARQAGITVSTQELQKAADLFRVVNGLNRASDTEKWLNGNGLTIDVFEAFLETNLLINKFKDTLEKEAEREKYLSSEAIRESVKEMVYQDWFDDMEW